MDYPSFREFVVHEKSEAHIDRVAQYIGNDPDQFAVLVEVICENAPKYAQKATWVMEHCCDVFPNLVDAHISRLLAQTQVEGHPGIRRGILRSLETRPMDEEQSAVALDIAFNFLSSPDEPVAVKVFAMGMIFHLSKNYPELLHELRLHIEAQLPYQSAAFRGRAQRIFKHIVNTDETI